MLRWVFLLLFFFFFYVLFALQSWSNTAPARPIIVESFANKIIMAKNKQSLNKHDDKAVFLAQSIRYYLMKSN